MAYDLYSIGALSQGQDLDQAGQSPNQASSMQGMFEDAVAFAVSPIGYFVGGEMKQSREADDAAAAMAMSVGMQTGQAVGESLLEANIGVPAPRPAGAAHPGGSTLVNTPNAMLDAPSGVFDFLSMPGPFGLSYGVLAAGAAVLGGGVYLAKKKRKGGRGRR